MKKIKVRRCRRAVLAAVSFGLALTGCGGGSSGSGGAAPVDHGPQNAFMLTGVVNGLNSTGLSLNVSGVIVPVQSDATMVTLASSLPVGTAYEVTVNTQPADENCMVTNGSGTVSGLVEVDVTVTCIPASAEVTLYAFTGGTDGRLPSSLIQGADGNFYGTTEFGGANDFGTAFKVTPGGLETVLYSFAGGSDGRNPQSGLIQAGDGSFYGTTSAGGTSDAGTVFRITPAGAETVLYSFPLSRDLPPSPSGLKQGGDGSFYGTTQLGGTYGFGTVFKVTPAGAETVVYSFNAAGDASGPTAGVIWASDGSLYGTTAFGGTDDSGAVFRITPAGTETVLYSFSNTGGDGYFPFSGLIQASDGNFYGATFLGGANGDGTVFRITPAGVETVLYSFTGGAAGTAPASGLIQGSDGNFYGSFAGCCTMAQPVTSGATQSSTLVSGGGVFEITPAGVYSVLYSFSPTSIYGDGPGGLIQAANGDFYGATSENTVNANGAVFQLTPVQ